MKKILSKYGYIITVNNDPEEDIEIYNEDRKLVAAFTQEDIQKLEKVLRLEVKVH